MSPAAMTLVGAGRAVEAGAAVMQADSRTPGRGSPPRGAASRRSRAWSCRDSLAATSPASNRPPAPMLAAGGRSPRASCAPAAAPAAARHRRCRRWRGPRRSTAFRVGRQESGFDADAADAVAELLDVRHRLLHGGDAAGGAQVEGRRPEPAKLLARRSPWRSRRRPRSPACPCGRPAPAGSGWCRSHPWSRRRRSDSRPADTARCAWRWRPARRCRPRRAAIEAGGDRRAGACGSSARQWPW